jgi:hypothetical protein
MSRTRTVLLALALLALPAAAATAAEALQAGQGKRWVHLAVDEGGDGARVRVNLPLALVERVAEMVPAEARGHARLVVGDEELTAPELRAIWRSLERGRNVRRIEVADPDETVYAWRHGDRLHLRVRDVPYDRPWNREDVHVTLPAAVVEALLSGGEDELDLRAAIRALAQEGDGELVTVAGDDETVRIWVDGSPHGRL